MVFRRRKGIAIVDTNKGILLVAGKNKKFTLPGGGAEKIESRKKAAIRELYEETGLKTKKITYLFRYKGDMWHNKRGKQIINYSKVFLVEHEGIPKPGNEIKDIEFWTKYKKINLHPGTEKIILKYLSKYKK